MTYTPNTTLYALFERIIREMLGTATSVSATLEGTRANGSTYTYHQELLPAEFGQIPWGRVDAIREAHWYPGGNPDRAVAGTVLSLPEFIHIRVFMDDWDKGIGVDTNVCGFTRTLLAGVKGTVERRSTREVVACDSEDEVVAAVRAVIDEVFSDYQAEMGRGADDQYFDDRSRYDPLDERNYPLNER